MTNKKTEFTRRSVLKTAGGIGAAVFSPAAAQNAPGKIPISLIVDDGSPVDPLFYEIQGYETPFLVPAEFTARVAETFERFDLRGKLTVIPMPSCLGRIDQSLKRVPQEHLQAFLKIVRERIAPRFDITPEFLTHLRAYDLKKGGYQHIFEDVWITRAPLEEVVEYFTLAFQILNNVGLPATGITSPWDSGISVVQKYAQALADAQWKVFQRKLTWFFLYTADSGPPRKLTVEYQVARARPDRCERASQRTRYILEHGTSHSRTAAIHSEEHRLAALGGWPHRPNSRADRIRPSGNSAHTLAVALHAGHRAGSGRPRRIGRAHPKSFRQQRGMGVVLRAGAALRERIALIEARVATGESVR